MAGKPYGLPATSAFVEGDAGPGQTMPYVIRRIGIAGAASALPDQSRVALQYRACQHFRMNIVVTRRLVEVDPQTSAASVSPLAELSHNLLGQRLGRKGRDTRDRILGAMQRLLDGPSDVAITLTAVAREASMGMTALYRYFADMPELLLAALEPLNAEANAVRDRFDHCWSDEELDDECSAFLQAHHGFWTRHSRLLHLRNSIADTGDQRMLEARRAMSQPVIACILRQLPGPSMPDSPTSSSYAVVIMTMIERMATITTDETFTLALTTPDGGGREAFVRETLQAEARIIALTIRDRRGR